MAGGVVTVASESTSRPWLRVGWHRRDQHRWLTWAGLAGLCAAAAMAVFGLPPVDLHGPLHRLGIMDPLCGGTRAARYTAQGQWASAWQYNPLGIVTVVAAVLAAVRAAVGLCLRRWLTVSMSWTARRRNVALVLLVIAVTALEIRQQLRADLLMTVAG
jgi:hypothetical protein